MIKRQIEEIEIERRGKKIEKLFGLKLCWGRYEMGEKNIETEIGKGNGDSTKRKKATVMYVNGLSISYGNGWSLRKNEFAVSKAKNERMERIKRNTHQRREKISNLYVN